MTTNVCCSASCCDGAGLPCCESPPSSCWMGASDALAMPRGSGGAPASDWSGDDVWRSGHLLSWTSRQTSKAKKKGSKMLF